MTLSKLVQTSFFQAAYGDTVGSWVSNIAKSWPVVLVSVAVAILLGYCYLLLTK
jgi:hypothetical protein